MKEYCGALLEIKSKYSPCLAQVQLPGLLSIITLICLFLVRTFANHNGTSRIPTEKGSLQRVNLPGVESGSPA